MVSEEDALQLKVRVCEPLFPGCRVLHQPGSGPGPKWAWTGSQETGQRAW